jgi:pre-mRNA-processing factor 19
MWSPTSDGNYSKYSADWSYDTDACGEVSSLCVHPSGNYLVAVGGEAWGFLDAVGGGRYLQGQGHAQSGVESSASAFTTGALHPDGVILGTGSAGGALRIWDLRTAENAHTLAGHSAGAMLSLAFSQNGFLAASGAADGSVRLWDLRKLAATQTLEGNRLPICPYASTITT